MGMLHRQRIAQGLDPDTGEPLVKKEEVKKTVVESKKKKAPRKPFFSKKTKDKK